MNINAATLRLMASKGLSIDDAIEIAEAMEGRSSAAERQKRYRDKRRNERDVTGDVTPPPYEDTSTPLAPLETKVSSGGKPARKATFVLPDHIPQEPWDGFEEMRKRIGKPMTDRARNLAITELDKLAEDGWPPGDVLNHCTMNSYQGIFPPKAKQNGRRGQHPEGRTGAAVERVLARFEAADSQHQTSHAGSG